MLIGVVDFHIRLGFASLHALVMMDAYFYKHFTSMPITPKDSAQNPFAPQEAYQRLRGLERQKAAIESVDTLLAKKAGDVVSDIENLIAAAGLETAPSETDAAETGVATKILAEMEEIQSELGEEQLEAEKVRAQKQLENFLSEWRRLRKTERTVRHKTEEFIRIVHTDPKLRSSARTWESISSFEAKADDIRDLIEDKAHEDPVAFKAYWLLKMREWKRDFEKNGIIETDAIKDQTRHVMHDARRKLEGTNGVVTLIGPTGSGKTVLAKKIGAQFSPAGEYEFVSAHPKMTAFDLIQRMGIVVEQLNPTEVPAKIKDAQKAYAEENPEMDQKELARELETIAEIMTGRAKEKTFETKPILEAIGRAQKEGRIVVIDEFNYLPPETLAALNEVLSNKTNAPGFGVVLTGNIGEEYLKRQPLDPAFINRVLSGTVKYEFPPQDIDTAFDDSIKDIAEEGGTPPSRDLFQIGMTQLADSQGNLLAPENAMRDVWDFSRIFSLTQHMAQGKDFRSLGLDAPQGTGAMKFKSVLLSFRNMNQVVREWKLDGFRKPLDWYIFDTIVRPAAVYAPREAAELMYLFRDWGGFFKGEEWDAIEVDPTNWRIAGIERVKTPRSKKPALVPYQTAAVVEAISGERLPEDTGALESAEREERERKTEVERVLAAMEATLTKMERETEKDAYAMLEQLCAQRAELTLDQA